MPKTSVFKSAFLNSSESSLYVVKRDGKTLTEPMSNNDCFRWLHDHNSGSLVDWSIKYEGYSIDPAQAGDGPNIPDLSSPEDQAFMKEMAISGSLKKKADSQLEQQQLKSDISKYKGLLAKTKDNKESEDLALKLSLAEAKMKRLDQKQAAGISASPRQYQVTKKQDGFWYVLGLEGEELSETSEGPPTVKTPDSWLNVHHNAKNLDLVEQLYRELYAEFQTNDNLKEGDIFTTPIGQFVCQGVDVLPYDDAAKAAVAEVDESYKCANCGCDQGKHAKGYDVQGIRPKGHLACRILSSIPASNA